MEATSLRGRRGLCSALLPSASAICRISPTTLSLSNSKVMAYVEAGDGRPILMLPENRPGAISIAGMIPTLAAVGRVIVPDLVGFGRSDKPVNDNAYSYRSHARWLRLFIEKLDLGGITADSQDWAASWGSES